MTEIFVPPFSPIYNNSSVTYPVVSTDLYPKERAVDGSLEPSRKLKVESMTYDNTGRMTTSQNYTMEVWA